MPLIGGGVVVVVTDGTVEVVELEVVGGAVVVVEGEGSGCVLVVVVVGGGCPGGLHVNRISNPPDATLSAPT